MLCVKRVVYSLCIINILLIKTTAAQNEVALTYHRVRGLYFLAVIFAATIYIVEVLEKNIRSTEFIDHSFERKFYGACYGLH